jgi:hypothetical protein
LKLTVRQLDHGMVARLIDEFRAEANRIAELQEQIDKF